jgi:transposase-like protein
VALADKKQQAEELYVREDLACPAIAERLGVNAGTVYRWKAEAAQDEKGDWEKKRRIYRFSGVELIGMYLAAVRGAILQISENPELMLNPQTADAFTKHISNAKKLDIRGQYLSVSLDLIKTANRWLAENQPELKAKLDPYWDSIYQALAEHSAKKGVLIADN